MGFEPLFGWADREYAALVELLAIQRGFLDVWSTEPTARLEVCLEARRLLDEIAYDDEEYLQANVSREIAEALEDYRLHVALALQALRENFARRNASLTTGVAQRPQAMKARRRSPSWSIMRPAI